MQMLLQKRFHNVASGCMVGIKCEFQPPITTLEAGEPDTTKALGAAASEVDGCYQVNYAHALNQRFLSSAKII